MELRRFHGRPRNALIHSAGYARPPLGGRSAGYAFPPLGVSADMLSAVKKRPNLFMLWGYGIPSNQAVASISMG
mgnify:CR=1 FL=1